MLLFQGSNNELQYVNVKALNEWDSRYVGIANYRTCFFGLCIKFSTVSLSCHNTAANLKVDHLFLSLGFLAAWTGDKSWTLRYNLGYPFNSFTDIFPF